MLKQIIICMNDDGKTIRDRLLSPHCSPSSDSSKSFESDLRHWLFSVGKNPGQKKVTFSYNMHILSVKHCAHIHPGNVSLTLPSQDKVKPSKWYFSAVQVLVNKPVLQKHERSVALKLRQCHNFPCLSGSPGSFFFFFYTLFLVGKGISVPG